MRDVSEHPRSLADLVAPFCRLPAAAVALLADAILERMVELHDAGLVGLDLQPAAIAVAPEGVQLMPTASVAPWLLAPERSSGGAPSAKGDLFALGAVLLELLLGRRVFDAGSAEASAALLARLTLPPPVALMVPTLPGFLERLLIALLQPDLAQRASDARSGRAVLDAPLVELRARFPNALAALMERTADACRAMHEAQASAEAERGAALLADPRARIAAAVCLLRSRALVPGQAQVTELLGQAAAAGVVRGERPRAAELDEVDAQIAGAEPNPPPALLRKAVALHLQGGELLEALGLMKRVMLAQPTNRILAAQLAELAPDAPNAPFAAGGEGVLAPLPAVAAPRAPTATSEAPAAAVALPDIEPSDEREPGPVGRVIRALGQAYGNLEARSRLFILVLAFGALTSAGLLMAQRAGTRPNRAVQLENLARAAADCQPGGRVVLIRAQQAARLGEVRVVEELLQHAEEKVPMGTRCHEFGVRLTASAQLVAREAR